MSERTPAFFAVIPAPVLTDTRLKANAKLIYGVISSLAERGGYCYASNAYIGGILGLSADAVGRLVSSLAECGHVAVRVLRNPETHAVDERRIYLTFGILVPPPGQISVTPPGQISVTPPGQISVIISKDNNNTPIAPIGGVDALAELEERFQTFWSAYPKKVDKRKTHELFLRLKPSAEDLAVWLAAIKRQRTSSQWSGGVQYIPSPLRWLRGAKWEDHLDGECKSSPSETEESEGWLI